MSTPNSKPYSGGFADKTHLFALRVYIEDTDLGGVVYHANYLRFFERARSDALRALAIDQRASIESGLGVYAVAEMQVKFCRPARLDDELIILSQVVEVQGARCGVGQKILRGTELIAEASVKLAFISPQGRPKRQPAAWVEKLNQVKS